MISVNTGLMTYLLARENQVSQFSRLPVQHWLGCDAHWQEGMCAVITVVVALRVYGHWLSRKVGGLNQRVNTVSVEICLISTGMFSSDPIHWVLTYHLPYCSTSRGEWLRKGWHSWWTTPDWKLVPALGSQSCHNHHVDITCVHCTQNETRIWHFVAFCYTCRSPYGSTQYYLVGSQTRTTSISLTQNNTSTITSTSKASSLIELLSLCSVWYFFVPRPSADIWPICYPRTWWCWWLKMAWVHNKDLMN